MSPEIQRLIVNMVPWLFLAGIWIYYLRGLRRGKFGSGAELRQINPAALGEPRGWTNGMVGSGNVLFVAGQTARDDAGRIVPGGMAAQWDQALANVLAIVEAGGGKPQQIARMTVFVTDLPAYKGSLKQIGAVWKVRLGRHYPAMSVVEVSGLVDEGALVEIEATAVLG